MLIEILKKGSYKRVITIVVVVIVVVLVPVVVVVVVVLIIVNVNKLAYIVLVDHHTTQNAAKEE